MDKANYLLDDFQQVTQNSDEAVFQLLKNKEEDRTGKSTGETVSQPDVEPNQSNDSEKSKTTKTKAKTPAKKLSSDRRWGKPVSILNTRIPQELSDLMDDLVYKSKKEGNPTTKQAITIEALTELARSRGLLKS